MSKKTILGLLIVANLYGQMASATEVIISDSRLQNISDIEISILMSQGALRFNQDKAILNLQRLDLLLRSQTHVESLAFEAANMSAHFIPHGNTADTIKSTDYTQLANELSSRFVPYGNT